MSIIVGVDEVGRGSLAGPVVAAAVVLPAKIRGLTDSKLLSRTQRQKLAAKIRAKALAVGIGWSTPTEVDQLGLTQAVRLAMQRALEEIECSHDCIIIDGNYNFLADNPLAECQIKADLTVYQVSAASIIAKVARDEFMVQLATDYPHYGFETNVGYGTTYHLEMLDKHGASDIHRQSYKPVAQLRLVV